MAKRKHPKTDLYKAERDKGLSYREIAEKYGVSKQRVQQACGKQSTAHFQYNDYCVYPGLRKWLNDNKISASELIRRMDMVAHATNNNKIRSRQRGEVEWKKSEIDKLIKITGMTYEELFRGDEDE